MRRLGTSIFCGALFAVALGCNSLLENEPGRLDRGASAGESSGGPAAGDGNGAAPIGGNGPDGGGTSKDGTSSSSSGDVGAPDAGAACAVGLKVCNDLCVSVADPFFGCEGPTCARCDAPNATAACKVGACGVGACVAGFGDCNALPADGCEANLQTSLEHCGGCGLACPQVENTDVACVAGVCTGTCAVGFGNCNGEPEDGCEKNLLKDKNNCGACGTRCIIGRCEEGVCVWRSDD